ncbi:hypothetical protein Y032_0535g3087 [Ancylostoma ceylanicum]|uniref:Integral membrane protein, C.elegans Sra family n=1 Tax=Ancylostoma ceylanicum TaxID=53326 RepID=A0A016WR76_9BILA|nr:hypothetical protein Y032_0535g3087 [Ancylostoma ceylanicum]
MNCAEVQALITSPGFLVVLGSQALAGFISALVSVIVTRKCGSLYFHINCKILMTSLLVFYIAHSFFISILQSIQLVQYFEYPDSCDVGISPCLCFWLRFPATVCMVSCVALQFAMVVERAVALYNRENYEKSGPILGSIFAAASVIASFIFSCWALRLDDYTEKTTYCSSATATSASRITVLSFALCGVDIVTLIGIVFLFLFNNIAVKRKFFDLQSSYQLRENISVIRFILPLTIFQTICFLIFTVSSGVLTLLRGSFSLITYRTLFAAIYIVPFYTMIAPILMLFIMRWSRQLKESKVKMLVGRNCNEKEVYFLTYAGMWNIKDF